MDNELMGNRLVATSDELIINRLKDATERKFSWTEVVKVVAYKVDLFSFDQVRVSFFTNPDQSFEISEDDDGFEQALSIAEGTIPNFPSLDAWKQSVAAEPFEKSETILWP